MAERDEVQADRWDAIRERMAGNLRSMRPAGRSQAQLAWELDELGFHISQSMVSRYEQGLGEVPLTLERIVGWALCCDALSSEHLRELLELAGYALPWTRGDMKQFDDLLTRYRSLSKPDQIVLRHGCSEVLHSLEMLAPGRMAGNVGTAYAPRATERSSDRASLKPWNGRWQSC